MFPSKQPKADPNNEYIGSVALLDALVNAQEGIRLHSTPDTQDSDYQLKQGIASKVYPQGTKVTIIGYGNEEHEGWALIQIVEDNGKTQTGWIEARYLKQNIPDPQAIFTKRKHEVKKGETLEKLLMQEYGATYDLKVGDDLRTIAEAFANLNKDNPGVYYTGEGGSWWRDLLDPSMKPARDLYQTIRIKKDHTVRLPSTEYINDLKKAGKLSQRSDIHNLAIEFGKGSTGFLLGFNFGLLKGAYDTVTGLVKLIYQLFTGELYAMFKQLFSMSWDDVQKLFGKILGDFEKKWNAPNPYDKWFFRGQVLGQIVFEIALAILSAGGGLVKNLARIEKLVPIINKFQSLKKVVITAAKSKLGKAEQAMLEKNGLEWLLFWRRKKKDNLTDIDNLPKLADAVLEKGVKEALQKNLKLSDSKMNQIIKQLKTEGGGEALAKRIVKGDHNTCPGYYDLMSKLKQKGELNVAKTTQALNAADDLKAKGFKDIFFERDTQKWGYDADVGAVVIKSGLDKSVIYQLKYVTSNKKLFDNIKKGLAQFSNAPREFRKVIDIRMVNMTYKEFVKSNRLKAIKAQKSDGKFGGVKIHLTFKDGVTKKY
ncbi:SH3 domain-containing protein [uncultured Microscilla sp.]|uniref:SH3 domain-containing protein n=1 Tax=uncultured Microscilla sp. TaxID=432653 RepID=UPI0026128FF7|nr:SH3 domain-containing protein [uncultured Microscilla sp.]